MTETRGLWRGKTLPKSNGEAFNEVWVKGDLIHFDEHYYIHPRANGVKVQGELGKLIVMHEVDPSTLGECTGLRDGNEKLIFEGDIVHFLGGENYNGVYEYDEIIVVEDITDGVCVYMGAAGFVEIIGNIHDDPGLIKGA